MHPILLDVAGISVSTYSVVMAVAIVVSVSLTVREAERRRLDVTYSMAVLVLLGGLVGARAFWILQFDRWTKLWQAVLIWSPGLVFYGGLAGGITTLVVTLRSRHVPLWPALDVAAPHAALGEGIARIGCFMAGCCWGRVCSVPWGVRFPGGSFAYVDQLQGGLLDNGAQTSLPVHPTQLYMALGLAAAFIVLRFVLNRRQTPGFVLAVYFTLYGALRFTVELYRGDSARPVWAMTASQGISIACVMAGIAAIFALRRVKQRSCCDPPDKT